MNTTLHKILPLFPLIVLCFAHSTNAYAKTLYVEKFGLLGAACSKSDPCPTINDALAIAGNNAKIIVGPGNYREALLIDKPGIKLESSGGQEVTQIRTDEDPLVGTPTIMITADKVAVGKKGGKGFTVRSRNAPTIQIGVPPTATGCIFDATSGFWDINFDFSNFEFGAKTRVESNYIRTDLDSPYATNVPMEPSFCDDAGNLVDQEYLPSLLVIGPDATVVGNVFRTEGTVAADLTPVSNKVLFQDNLIKFQPETALIDGFTSPGGIVTFANSATIKGNAIYDWRDFPDFWGQSGDGIFAGGPKIKISNNLVEGFRWGASGWFGATIEKNVIKFVNFTGIDTLDTKKVTDNTVAFWGGIENRSIGIEIFNMDKGQVSGNTVTSLNGPGVRIFNTAPHPVFGGGGSLKKFEKNNFYITDYDGDRCAVVIEDAGTSFTMKKNFYGDPSKPLNSPEILTTFGGVPASGHGDAICVTSGMYDGITGIIENVTYSPTNTPNKVKALYKPNHY